MEAFKAAKLSADATLRPLLGELRPEDERDILAALRDDENTAAEAATKFRETKPNVRAAREKEAETLEHRAKLIEQNAASSVSILKKAQKIASSLGKVGVIRFDGSGSKLIYAL